MDALPATRRSNGETTRTGPSRADSLYHITNTIYSLCKKVLSTKEIFVTVTILVSTSFHALEAVNIKLTLARFMFSIQEPSLFE